MSRFDKYFYSFLVLFILYVSIGFKLIPYIIKDQLVKNLDKHLTLKTKIKEVQFNPFIFKAKIIDFSLNKKEEKIIGFSHFLLDFQAIKSLINGYINVKHLELNNAYIKIVENEDSSFNFESFVKKQDKKEETKQEKEEKESLKFLVSKLFLLDTTIDFIRKKDNYNLSINNINYKLYDFGNYKNSLASSEFSLKINKHTNFKIKGGLSIEPLYSYGEIKLENLKINELLKYKKEILNFNLKDKASANLTLSYDFKVKDKADLKLKTSLFNINKINLEQNNKTIFNLGQFSISTLAFDLIKQNINIEDINIKDLFLYAKENKNSLNFSQLIKKDEKTKIRKKEEAKTSKAWNVNLNSLSANKIEASYKSKTKNIFLNTKMDLKINKIDIKDNIFVKELQINKNKTLFKDYNKALQINNNLSLKINDINFKKKITVNSIKIKNNKTNLLDETNQLRISSLLDLDLKEFLMDEKISLKKIKVSNKQISLKKNGNLSIQTYNNNLALKDFEVLKNDILIKKVNFSNKKTLFKQKKQVVSSENFKFHLNDLSFKNEDLAFSLFKLYEDNLIVENHKDKTKLMIKAFDFEIHEFLRKKTQEISIKKSLITKPSISFLMAKKEEIKVKKQIKKEERNKEKEKKEALKLNIGPILIKEASLKFEDKNLPLSFVADISALNGQISALDTIQASTTKLNLDGIINEYGLAKITGIVDPNNIKILTDINVILRNIAVKDFSAYSGKFIGKRIDSGKLDVNLKYNILKSDLDAKNNVLITKIKFGKKVKSKDALSLPIGLAIALLENSDGVIDLNIPVTGNIDDPKFEIAPIVWMTLKNLITKAVTAPFKLLGSLFGFDEKEIKEISFNYGESLVGPIQKEPLDKILKILEKKKKLKIKLNASYNLIMDEKALKEKRFNEELKKALPNTQVNNYKKKYTLFLEKDYSKTKKDLKVLKKKFKNKKEYLLKLKTLYKKKIKITKYDLEKLALNRILSIEKYLENKINKTQLEINRDIEVFNSDLKYLNIPVKLTSNN